jgi:lysozyme family protein
MADYRRQIGFIKKWEGGLSNNPNDSASAFPMPCAYAGEYGWHTNKGITWQTFSSYASSLGYTASCENFVQMPDSIWLKIFKKKFWDAFSLDSYNSQSIADIIVAWAWGSGLGGAYRQLAKFLNSNYGTSLPENKSDYTTENVLKLRDVFNAITRRANRERIAQEDLIEHYRNFYFSLNNPYYLNGWLNRLNELDSFTQETLKDASPKWLWYIAITFGVAAAVMGGINAVREYKSYQRVKREYKRKAALQ